MVHEVMLQPDGWRLPVRDGETIEQAMTRSGFAHRHRGCRRGGCGICVADRVQGDSYHERPVAPTVLTADALERGAILICRAVPTTDLVVDVRDNVLRLVSPLQHTLALRELGRDRRTVTTREGN